MIDRTAVRSEIMPVREAQLCIQTDAAEIKSSLAGEITVICKYLYHTVFFPVL